MMNRRAVDQADRDVAVSQLVVSYGNDLVRTACAMLNVGVSTTYTASSYFNRYAEKTILRKFAPAEVAGQQAGRNPVVLAPPAPPSQPPQTTAPNSVSLLSSGTATSRNTLTTPIAQPPPNTTTGGNKVRWARHSLLGDELKAINELIKKVEEDQQEALEAHRKRFSAPRDSMNSTNDSALTKKARKKRNKELTQRNEDGVCTTKSDAPTMGSPLATSDTDDVNKNNSINITANGSLITQGTDNTSGSVTSGVSGGLNGFNKLASSQPAITRDDSGNLPSPDQNDEESECEDDGEDKDEDEPTALAKLATELKRKHLALIKKELFRIKKPLMDFNEHLSRVTTSFQADASLTAPSFQLLGGGSGVSIPSSHGVGSGSGSSGGPSFGNTGCSTFATLLAECLAEESADTPLPLPPPVIRGKPQPLLWSTFIDSVDPNGEQNDGEQRVVSTGDTDEASEHIAAAATSEPSSPSSASPRGGANGFPKLHEGRFATESVTSLWDFVREIAERHSSQNPIRADLDLLPVAAACVLLAAKATFWRLPDGNSIITYIAMVFEKIDRRRKGARARDLRASQSAVKVMKEAMTLYERDILDVLGFEMSCEVPHKYALNAVAMLFEGSGLAADSSSKGIPSEAITIKGRASCSSEAKRDSLGNLTDNTLSPTAQFYKFLVREVVRVCNDTALSTKLTTNPSPQNAMAVACAAIQVAANRLQLQSRMGSSGQPASVGNGVEGNYLQIFSISSSEAATRREQSLPDDWFLLFGIPRELLSSTLDELRRLFGTFDAIAARTITVTARPQAAGRYPPTIHASSLPDDADTNGGSCAFCATVTADMAGMELETNAIVGRRLSFLEDRINTFEQRETQRKAEETNRLLLEQLSSAALKAAAAAAVTPSLLQPPTPSATVLSPPVSSNFIANSAPNLAPPSLGVNGSTSGVGYPTKGGMQAVGGGFNSQKQTHTLLGGTAVLASVAAILENADDIGVKKKKSRKERDVAEEANQLTSLSPIPPPLATSGALHVEASSPRSRSPSVAPPKDHKDKREGKDKEKKELKEKATKRSRSRSRGRRAKRRSDEVDRRSRSRRREKRQRETSRVRKNGRDSDTDSEASRKKRRTEKDKERTRERSRSRSRRARDRDREDRRERERRERRSRSRRRDRDYTGGGRSGRL